MTSADTPTAPFRDRPRGATALLIVDMIGTFDFADADIAPVVAAAHAIGRLRDTARAAEVPVIYVNDNAGEWHSEASRLVDRALAANSRGRDVAERLRPEPQDYFIIKPQLSGFYATNLPVLLPKLGVSRLIVTGNAADMCVLFTAADAHMRDYAVWVPADCAAAAAPDRKRWALELLRQNLHVEVQPTDAFSLDAWLGGGEGAAPSYEDS